MEKEKIIDSTQRHNDENEAEIMELTAVIQRVKDIKETSRDIEITSSLQNTIVKCEEQIEFLEGEIESNMNYLNKNGITAGEDGL